MRTAIGLVSCVVLVCTLSSALHAQQAANATLNGRIIDQNKAVIPHAIVTATHKATVVSRETITNYEGSYVLAKLPPGEYELKVQATGFAVKVSQAPVVIQVGQTTTIDTTLEVGETRSTVNLVGEARLVQTSTSMVEGVIDEREVQSLPLNGRLRLGHWSSPMTPRFSG